MTLWYLYFLLAAILFPLISTINVLYGRKIGARKIALYRQLTLTIIGSPLLIGIASKPEILQKHALLIFLCGLFGATYLTVAFHAMNLTSIGISRSFVAVSRTITGFLIGFFLFQESISLYDISGVFLICLGFYLLSHFRWEHFSRKDILWVGVSLVAGVLFSINTLIFKLFAADFSPIESAYLLESSSVLFLIVFTFFATKCSLKKTFSIEWKKLSILFLTSPFLLLASYGLAKSVNDIPFYIFNTLFILMLIVSIILSWIFLKEKFTLKQLSAMWIMMIGCGVVIIF